MAERLYNLTDWQEIKAVVYSEENAPRKILGPKITSEGIRICCFFPDKKSVSVKTLSDNKIYSMIQEDDRGFFSVLIPGKEIPGYIFLTETEGEIQECYDAYAFPAQITKEDEQKFSNGICYDIYKKLGAHPMTVNGVEGVNFAVWAPNAMRVSVVGDFNHWDGRMYPMQFLPDSGIFELFIPQIPIGSFYKFELKLRDGLTYLKADPYANEAEVRPATASVITDLNKYHWSDKNWMRNRNKVQNKKAPVFVYELHLGSWRKPEDGREFYNYREIAPMLVEYVQQMGYTHVELLPIMEHPYDASWGYQITGYYAPTSRYGNPEDFMWFVDTLHQAGIGVILDWVPAHFPRDTFGLSSFDGTCLYEHLDPRQSSHPYWGTLLYNYGRPQVRNFLIANALFWADKFHIDGLQFDSVSSMLYLDYGKSDGQWVANIYGGNENLEAAEFIKHLNSIMKKKYPDVLLLAEGSAAWPKLTSSLEEEGLGFDFKWNMNWTNDFLNYMGKDPYFRGGSHNDLTFSMIYAYSEAFMLSFSHDEVVHGKGSLWNKMPGDEEKKFANLRLAMGYFITHPGKKLIFMGQDFAQKDEWAEDKALGWDCLQEESHQKMQKYMKNLIALYKQNPALYELDDDSEGFEWINCVDWEKSAISFIRKTDRPEDTILVVCNFSDVEYEQFCVGVPYTGKYKEILNSDASVYGGKDAINAQIKMAAKEEQDDRPYSIKIKLAPLSICMFQYKKTEKQSVKKDMEKAADDTFIKKKEGLKKFLQEKILTEEKKGLGYK